jgi:hypothetical protein
MKKEEFAKLALMGLASGILTSNGIEAFQDTQPNSQLLAKGCNSLADKCGNKCSHGGAVAGNCGGKSGCGGAIAGNCGGKSGCGGAVAGNCGGKSGCGGAVAGNCGGKHGCGGAVAENEHTKSLTAPAPIPKDDSKKDDTTKKEYNDPNDQNIGYHVLTDDELTLELNDDMLKVYEAMSPETKALARLVASARCNGTNECKGLNACKTETNSCAGKGSCKGQGKCAFSDKNLAVRVVADKMQAKRNTLTK